MYTVTILYAQPKDQAAFDRYYDDVHIPLASRMRGLVRWTVQRAQPQNGVVPPYHMIVQLSAETREALQAVLGSPEGLAAAEDVPKFASGGATFLFGEQWELGGPSGEPSSRGE